MYYYVYKDPCFFFALVRVLTQHWPFIMLLQVYLNISSIISHKFIKNEATFAIETVFFRVYLEHWAKD